VTWGNIVLCIGPAAGNFGQVELTPSKPAPPPSYPIPATPPPAGVAPAQQARADQIWNRATALLDSNPLDAMPLLYQCALRGDKRCEATLGIRYQDGDGVPRSRQNAIEFFRASGDGIADALADPHWRKVCSCLLPITCGHRPGR
jgi:hypothetical protein